MADTTITIPDLGSLTAGQASDLLLVTRGTTGYKMLLSDLAKYMVETYNSSSLAGSAQSVKNAIDSLNSRFAYTTLSNSDDLNNLLVGSLCYIGANTPQNAPTNNVQYAFVYTLGKDNQYRHQLIFPINSDGRIYKRMYSGNPASWRAWKVFIPTDVS